MCIPSVVNKSCEPNLLRLNGFDCISREKMLGRCLESSQYILMRP